MRVPLLDLSQQYRTLAAPIRAQIEEVLGSQRFILGSKVEAFEQAICAYCAAPHAIGVSSGTEDTGGAGSGQRILLRRPY